jgi:hypothetical protein
MIFMSQARYHHTQTVSCWCLYARVYVYVYVYVCIKTVLLAEVCPGQIECVTQAVVRSLTTTYSLD